jgi:transcriptional regulator with XRE-family HTH domain
MKQTVNERVKSLRTKLNLTQQEFAEAIGITSAQLSRIENGENTPQDGTLKKIAHAASVDLNWLKLGIGDVEPKLVNESSSVENPWKEEAYKALKDEVAFYRQLLMQVTGGKAASFLQALNGTGLPKKRSLRAAA